MKTLTRFFAIIGVVSTLYFLVGLTLDIVTFDQTKGGYEPPYEGWTGKPIDWDSLDQTATGLVKRGHVVDIFVDGTTGMISFGIFGMKYDWRTFSERALKVHKPREALKERGFDPQF